MTPSGWHDDARNRDAGHDEMQLAVLRHLKDRDPSPLKFKHNGEEDTFTRHAVAAEFAIV